MKEYERQRRPSFKLDFQKKNIVFFNGNDCLINIFIIINYKIICKITSLIYNKM